MVPDLPKSFFECDGFLLGSPDWVLGSTGVMSDFRDRIFWPKDECSGSCVVWGAAVHPEVDWKKVILMKRLKKKSIQIIITLLRLPNRVVIMSNVQSVDVRVISVWKKVIFVILGRRITVIV